MKPAPRAQAMSSRVSGGPPSATGAPRRPPCGAASSAVRAGSRSRGRTRSCRSVTGNPAAGPVRRWRASDACTELPAPGVVPRPGRPSPRLHPFGLPRVNVVRGAPDTGAALLGHQSARRRRTRYGPDPGPALPPRFRSDRRRGDGHPHEPHRRGPGPAGRRAGRLDGGRRPDDRGALADVMQAGASRFSAPIAGAAAW
jgi:hypothetical protein